MGSGGSCLIIACPAGEGAICCSQMLWVGLYGSCEPTHKGLRKCKGCKGGRQGRRRSRSSSGVHLYGNNL